MFSYNVQELVSNKHNYSKVKMSPEFFVLDQVKTLVVPGEQLGEQSQVVF